MLFLFAGTLLVLALGYSVLLLLLRARISGSAALNSSPEINPARYKPMLRLLSDDDFRLVASHPGLRRTLRSQRCRLFRGYLNCLSRDYGRLLAGLRLAMVQSGIDRPDLAHALMRSRLAFTIALCNAEIRLALYAAGIGKVDISGLVTALDVLRAQAGALQTAPTLAR